MGQSVPEYWRFLKNRELHQEGFMQAGRGGIKNYEREVVPFIKLVGIHVETEGEMRLVFNFESRISTHPASNGGWGFFRGSVNPFILWEKSLIMGSLMIPIGRRMFTGGLNEAETRHLKRPRVVEVNECECREQERAQVWRGEE